MQTPLGYILFECRAMLTMGAREECKEPLPGSANAQREKESWKFDTFLGLCSTRHNFSRFSTTGSMHWEDKEEQDLRRCIHRCAPSRKHAGNRGVDTRACVRAENPTEISPMSLRHKGLPTALPAECQKESVSNVCCTQKWFRLRSQHYTDHRIFHTLFTMLPRIFDSCFAIFLALFFFGGGLFFAILFAHFSNMFSQECFPKLFHSVQPRHRITVPSHASTCQSSPPLVTQHSHKHRIQRGRDSEVLSFQTATRKSSAPMNCCTFNLALAKQLWDALDRDSLEPTKSN